MVVNFNCPDNKSIAAPPPRKTGQRRELGKVSSFGNWIQSAVAEAEHVWNLENALQSMKEPEIRIKHILDNFLMPWYPIPCSGFDPGGFCMNPVAAWSQQRLLETSIRHPELTAKSVSLRRELIEVGEDSNNEFKRQVGFYISSESRNVLDRHLLST